MVASVAFGLCVALLPDDASAACDCGSTDMSAPCTGTSTSRQVFGSTIAFEFDCAGQPCQCGQFVNGDYWVAAVDAAGTVVGAVTVTAVTPAGEEHGMEANPADPLVQGILNGYANYDASRNVMTALPYEATPETSLIKMVRRADPSTCGTAAIQTHGCAEVYDVLTVLGAVPQGAGGSVFRPPFAGADKPLLDVDAIELARLPQIPAVTGHSWQSNLPEVAQRWSVPMYDNMHLSEVGEQFRATAPHAVLDSYGATQADQYLQDLVSLFGTEPEADKRAAVLALVQKGIDVWGAYQAGISFGSGAGQHLGRKPALAFFAALYDDPALLASVRAIATDPVDSLRFQEDAQIHFSVDNTMALWGDGEACRGEAQGDPDWYWSQYFGEWQARNGGSGYDNKGTSCDPHGFIDGSAGGPNPTEESGRDYQGCCSAGPLISYTLAMHLMPWLKHAAGDSELIVYADRVYEPPDQGRWWTAPDPCAPVDPAESPDCQPYRAGDDGCVLFKVTWGPDPSQPGDCIRHGGDPMTDGRWSDRHDERFSILRLGFLVRELWVSHRACADPADPSYPCEGLGPAPDIDPEPDGGTGPEPDGGAEPGPDAAAAPALGAVSSGEEESGCGCRVGSASSPRGPAWLGALGLGALAARRRRRRAMAVVWAAESAGAGLLRAAPLRGPLSQQCRLITWAWPSSATDHGDATLPRQRLRPTRTCTSFQSRQPAEVVGPSLIRACRRRHGTALIVPRADAEQPAKSQFMVSVRQGSRPHSRVGRGGCRNARRSNRPGTLGNSARRAPWRRRSWSPGSVGTSTAPPR